MVWAVATLHSPLPPAAAGEEGWLGEAQSASTPCPFLALPSSSPPAPKRSGAAEVVECGIWGRACR